MSVVVWDGKILAADTRSVACGLMGRISKIRLHSGEICAWTGQADHGEALFAWYVRGAKQEDYPAFQSTPDWTRFIVVSGQTHCKVYEQTPFPISEYAPCAWGSGRDFALGALAMGADAIKSVEIACQFSVGCGLPVESFNISGIDDVVQEDKMSDPANNIVTEIPKAAGRLGEEYLTARKISCFLKGARGCHRAPFDNLYNVKDLGIALEFLSDTCDSLSRQVRILTEEAKDAK